VKHSFIASQKQSCTIGHGAVAISYRQAVPNKAERASPAIATQTGRSFRTGSHLAALAIFVMIAGCTAVEQAQQSVGGIFRPLSMGAAKTTGKRAHQITQEELDQLTLGFSDRYATYIGSAMAVIERDNADATQRRRVHQVRLVQVSAVYDIVTNADPFTRLMDLLLTVTLQSQKWIEDDQAEKWFGERARPLIDASRKTREDIWQIAARAMTTDQLEVLDYLVWDWRRQNPEIEIVSYVRFDDVAAARGKSIVADVKSGSGLLAPVGEATKAVDEARILAERAFFYVKRLPILLNWQVRLAVDDVLAQSEMQEISRGLLGVTRMVEKLPQDIAREREVLLTTLKREQPLFDALSSQYRGAVGDTTTLVGSLTEFADTSQQTLAAFNELVKTMNKDGRPFDIREYGATLDKLTAALQQADRLAGTGLAVAQTAQPQSLTELMKGGSQQTETLAARILDTAFWRGFALMIVFFVMLALYRLFCLIIDRRGKIQ
jgi:hypothetical protein